jgi:hypothetical protein
MSISAVAFTKTKSFGQNSWSSTPCCADFQFYNLVLFMLLISGSSQLVYQFTKRAIKLTVVIIGKYHCYQLHTKFFPNILLSRLSPYIDEIIGDHQCGFRHNRSTTDQIRSKSLCRWYINTLILFLDIIHRPVFIYNTKRFGDWILSPSSGGTYSVGPNR